jgi:hypothetical protein
MKYIKKIIPLLLLCFVYTGTMAQAGGQAQINIINFTVKQKLPADVSTWNSVPASLVLVAKYTGQGNVVGSKLVVQIKKAGIRICGNDQQSSIFLDAFQTRNFSANELTGYLTQCPKLSPGSYTLCVQFYGEDRKEKSTEVCRPFTIEDEVQVQQSYSPPQNITPGNGKTFKPSEVSGAVTFRWTPLVPKPQQPVTYRLKVWQLMQGQNSTQAMRTNPPIVTKDVDNITQAVVTNIYTGPCRPPYLCDFVWNVQAVDKDGKPLGSNNGASELYSFSVSEEASTMPPKLIAPVDEKSFTPKDMSAPISFRWTPLVPKPQQPVTYRLKVWQLMQGQNSTEAMRTNKPIVTKDVADVTEATVSNIYTGPCRPPYLCDFIWQVQALDREGKPIGNNEGKSEAWSFKVQNNIDIQIDSVKVGCCVDGKQSIYIKVKNNLATAVNIVAIKYKINGVGAAIPLSPIAPPLVQNIVGNGTKIFTSSINCIDAANFLKFLVDAEDVADPDNKETEVASDTLKCRCDACDEKNFSLTAPSPAQINFANNILSFAQSLTVGSIKPVKNIKAELVYFEMVPENNYCMPCNKDAATYGHFSNGTNSMEWNTVNVPQNFNITTPQMTPCCSAVFKWCIRYKIEFKDCTTCNKIVCYEKKKEGCTQGH